VLPNENKYDAYFEKYGKQYGIDPLFLKAQIKQESRFDPKAVSRVGAKGLAQFMPKTWQEWGDYSPGIQTTWKSYDPFKPEDSLHSQAAYMSFLLKFVRKRTNEYNNEYALACYNWGMGNVLNLIRDTNYDYYLFYVKLPEETQNYIRLIDKYYQEYKTKYYLTTLGEIKPRGFDEVE